MEINCFEKIRQKYGMVGSWAVWDLKNIQNLEVIYQNVDKLHTDTVLVGLNVSKQIESPFSNFHSTKNNDFKLAFAMNDSKFYGSYMTDIIKGNVNGNSAQLMNDLNPRLLRKHTESLKEELDFIGGRTKVILAFGNAAYKILESSFNDKYKIFRFTHYSYRFNGCSNPKIYKKRVQTELLSLPQ